MFTVEQVGQMVKKKYTGAYDGHSDLEVGKAFLQKNPDYSAVLQPNEINKVAPPTTQQQTTTDTEYNKDGSGGVADVGIGILKGAGSTIKNVGQLGAKVLDQTVGRLSNAIMGYGFTPTNAGADDEISKQIDNTLEAKNTAQSIGKGAEQIAEFFIPGGAVTKAGKALEATSLASKLLKVEETGSVVGKLAGLGRVGFTHGLPEAISTGLVTFAQGGDTNDVTTNSAFAGAIPVLGKGFSILKDVAGPALKEARTGVPAQIWKNIKEMPDAYATALKHVTENKEQPFLSLANTVAGRLKTSLENAGKYYTAGIDELAQKTANKTFNLSGGIQDVIESLKKNFNLTVKKIGNSYGVVKTAQTPYSKEELAIVNDLLNSISSSTKTTLKDVIDLNRKFSNAYKRIPLGSDNKALPIHAMIESLANTTEKIAEKSIPELKPINAQYAAVRQVYSEFASKFLDKQGHLASTAEQFLSNLGNLNKGALRTNLARLEEVTGLPIKDNVQLLKDAQKLKNLFPATGSRTQDILRSLGITGLATSVAGPVGAGVGLVATSPLATGKIAIKSAQAAKKFETLPEGIKNFIKLLTGEDFATVVKKTKK